MRGRSYTPSPPPPRGYGRRGRSPSPRGRYSGRGGSGGGRDLPTSLLVRNLRHDCRPEDLRRPFGQFGPLKDIYLPRDYYTREPRGFGFVQFVDPNDATEAKYQMDGQILLGRELTVVFAEENRKKPVDMRARERVRGRHDRRRSPPRSRSPYSRSPPPRRGRSRSLSADYDSPSLKRRHYSRSVSPRGRSSREKYSRHSRDRSYSRSRSPPENGTRGRSRSPARVERRSHSRSQSPARVERPSVSPNPRGYLREPDQDRSPGP